MTITADNVDTEKSAILNAEQLALCMPLFNLCPGKLTIHSNRKYIYTCKTLFLMITFIMFARFLLYFADVLFSGNCHQVYKHLLLSILLLSSILKNIAKSTLQ